MTTTKRRLASITAELNASTSLAPRLARGSSTHYLPEYQAQYAADALELSVEMASNPYTRRWALARKLLVGAGLTLATLYAAPAADAKPHRKAPQLSQWMRTCIHERTGPDGGLSVTEARAICRAEQPDDEVAAAKQQLAEAKAGRKLDKAKERARKAIEACEQAVVDSCVAAAGPDGSPVCEDDAIRAAGAFDICH